MYYFYTIHEKDQYGYKRSGWVKAKDKEEAKAKLYPELQVDPILGQRITSHIELSFQMSEEEFERDMKREFQGD